MSKNISQRTPTFDSTETRVQPFSRENLPTEKKLPPRENQNKNSI